jgi:hypothetical protein
MKAHTINSGTALGLLGYLLMAGCVHKGPEFLHVTGPYSDASIERCLTYWTANYSTNAVKHYYAGACSPRGAFNDAFVYWKEERTLMDYAEPARDSDTRQLRPGEENFAFHHNLRLDKNTVDTGQEVSSSPGLETHRQWLDWMEPCLAKGKEYVITLAAARKLFPPCDEKQKALQTTPKVMVKGETKKGPLREVAWKDGMTAWDAIQEAGGITRFAADNVCVYRNGKSVGIQTVYWSRLIKLMPDDVVVVDND